jgi:hypothetical protein
VTSPAAIEPEASNLGCGRHGSGGGRDEVQHLSILTEAEAGRGMSWPKALRRVRGWLTPWVFLQRCWRGWSTSEPPRQLQQALEWVGVGPPLHLYLPP